MDNVSNIVSTVTVYALPVLFAITLHEVAHGWVASKFGDKTALRLGRVTLNPLKHIDPIGTILVPLVFVILGGFIFGWAKPVPVDFRNLKNPRRDGALVALAGPFSNLLMAVFWGCIAKLGMMFVNNGMTNFKFFFYMGVAGIQINLMLGILNLIPLPPLDGSRVVSSALPRKIGYVYDSIEPYGIFILLFLIGTGFLTAIVMPPLGYLSNILFSFFGIR
jgi:Zn-dependent protease